MHKVDAVAYQGVTWDIVAPARHPLEMAADYARHLPTVGEAKIPPKCPKCGVELEEKKGLVYGHIWRCVACDFKKRNRDSFYTEAVRAEKIWRGRAETDAAADVAAGTTPAMVPKE